MYQRALKQTLLAKCLLLLAHLQREWGSKGRRESLTVKVPSLEGLVPVGRSMIGQDTCECLPAHA